MTTVKTLSESNLNTTLQVVKVKRSWAIVSGYNVLRKFKTEAQALAELEKNDTLYEYWAKSACSTYINAVATNRTQKHYV